MKKFLSLIKANLTEGMNIFKISTKKKNIFTRILLPIIIAFILMATMYSYADIITKKLAPNKMEYASLTIFIIVTSIVTMVEGVYKSGNLLFNCKDDNLLFSLPIKRNTILFIRVLKFYIFELIFNSLFLVPTMAVYVRYANPSASFYFTSIIGLFLFPIIPILVSCVIGTIITFVASKFKGKNIIQTILTMGFLLFIIYFSQNFDNVIKNIAQNATSVNNFITKIYYPAGAYIELITEFNVVTLLEFILINICIFAITIIVIGKIYFNINSSAKSIKKRKSNKKYKIKSLSPMSSLIKKEFSRFINSPVFITNAGFGLVLFICGAILMAVKFDGFISMLYKGNTGISTNRYITIIFFGFICFTSFMTSITSSMISLEGKSINILKSLPIKSYTIIKSKILTAILIMIPFILVGDIIVFIKYSFDFFNMVFILLASILLPLVSETIGIIINLKYPRMDAQNDTEVVKQSMSSAISVFLGMLIIGLTVYLLYKAVISNISTNIIMVMFLAGYSILYLILIMILHKTCEKRFYDISV